MEDTNKESYNRLLEEKLLINTVFGNLFMVVPKNKTEIIVTRDFPMEILSG